MDSTPVFFAEGDVPGRLRYIVNILGKSYALLSRDELAEYIEKTGQATIYNTDTVVGGRVLLFVIRYSNELSGVELPGKIINADTGETEYAIIDHELMKNLADINPYLIIGMTHLKPFLAAIAGAETEKGPHKQAKLSEHPAQPTAPRPQAVSQQARPQHPQTGTGIEHKLVKIAASMNRQIHAQQDQPTKQEHREGEQEQPRVQKKKPLAGFESLVNPVSDEEVQNIVRSRLNPA
jgi:hypothetical protein